MHAISLAARPAAAALTDHAPIDIEGNAGFNATNGVLLGAGTSSSPFVISGWSINVGVPMGIQVRNTDAHVVFRNLRVSAATVVGLYFYRVSNVSLVNVTAEINVGEGIRFESSHNFAVEASAIGSNAAGLIIQGSTDAAVTRTNVTANAGEGASVTNSPNVTFSGNTFAANGQGSGYGIDLSYTTDDILTGNRFEANGVYLQGDLLSYYDSHTITADNVVSGLPILYYKDCNGLGLTGMSLGQLLLAGCHRTKVSNSTVGGGDLGIQIAFGTDAVVGPNVTVSDAVVGIQVMGSQSVQVTGNSVLDCLNGVVVDTSTGVRVSNNKISAPFAVTAPMDALAIRTSSRVTAAGNILRHHRYGVGVVSSDNVSLLGNVAGFDIAGVNVSASRDLLISGNLLSQDVTGISAGGVTNATFTGNGVFGFLTAGANVSASSRLRFFGNAFDGSHDNAHDARAANDSWDAGYPTGGNFWRDYVGVDDYRGALQNLPGSDGIGDTPYAFPVNATDRYPLMTSPVTRDVPPEALLVAGPPTGTVLTTFQMTANFSSDYEDALGVLQVRWSFDDNVTWTPWTTTKYATHVFPIPGQETLLLQVQDSAGLTDTASAHVNVLPKPDGLPPAIEFMPPPSANVGEPITVRADITDLSGVADATLVYRGVDGGAFVSLPMRFGLNNTIFLSTIPAQPHAGTVEVAVFANDTWQNQARAPLTSTVSIRILDPLLPVIIGVVLGVALTVAAGVVFYALRRRRRKTAALSPNPTEPPPPGDSD